MKRTLLFILLLLTTSLPIHADSIGQGFDLESFAYFAQQWLESCEAPDWCNGADYNQDGTVNLDDLGQYANNWMSPIMLLRNATGHGSVNIYDVPDVGVTNGNTNSAGHRVSSGSSWGATGIRFSIDVPTRITGFAGIGGIVGGDAIAVNNMSFALSIHTSEDAFALSPFNGDAVDASGKTIDRIGMPHTEIVRHGTSSDGDGRYYTTFGLEGDGDDFTLLPGEYIISISDYASLAIGWVWSTSDTILPTTDILTHWGIPGEYDEFTDWGETISALDIYGYPDYTIEHKIRSATGYPDVSKTNGSELVAGFYIQPDFWGVTAHRVTITKPTEITKIAGVGGSPNSDAPWLPNASFHLNVHNAHDGLSREDAFGENPFHGYIVDDLTIGGVSTSEVFGINSENNINYYITVDLVENNRTVVLQPGDYIISIFQRANITGVWGWATNSSAGYSDIASAATMPQEDMTWLQLSDYGYDSAAVDIYGRVVE